MNFIEFDELSMVCLSKIAIHWRFKLLLLLLFIINFAPLEFDLSLTGTGIKIKYDKVPPSIPLIPYKLLNIKGAPPQGYLSKYLHLLCISPVPVIYLNWTAQFIIYIDITNDYFPESISMLMTSVSHNIHLTLT